MRFSAPDAGGGSDAGASGPAANGAATDIDPTLFDKLPWDELDDDSKAILETIKKNAVATLQSKTELDRKFQIADKNARQFQSEVDRLKAESQKGFKKEEPDDPYAKIVTEALSAQGYTAQEQEKLVPVFADMFRKAGAVNKTEIGKDLAPMAGQVLASQAQDAWAMAQSSDPAGMLQIPEVAQKVWDRVKERVGLGEGNSPEFILSLAKIEWADHQIAQGKAGGNTPALPVTPPNMNTGGFSYPGSGGGGLITPTATRAADPNAARTTLNDDTTRALAQTFKATLAGMEGKVKPPTALKDAMATPARRNR